MLQGVNREKSAGHYVILSETKNLLRISDEILRSDCIGTQDEINSIVTVPDFLPFVKGENKCRVLFCPLLSYNHWYGDF